MEANRSLLEELRHRLSSLESSQRASGSTADPGFLARTFAGETTSSPDAAQPAARPGAPEARASVSTSSAVGHGSLQDDRHTVDDEVVADGGTDAGSGQDGDGDDIDDTARGPYLGGGFEIGHDVFTGRGELASGVAFVLACGFGPRRPHPSQAPEHDLFETASELGALTRAKERLLVSIVAELESRGLDSPGGLSRTDWLRTQDPTLSAAQAKAIVTVAKAFAEPRWEALKEAVVGDTDADAAAVRVVGEDMVSGWTTVGHAAQVIEFHDRLHKVADPDELDQATTHLTEQAKTLRPEELAKLARLLGDQVRPPKDTDDQDKACKQSRGLWWGQPNATGMVHLKGLFDPEGAAILKSAIDPLAAPRPLTGDCGDTIETDERSPEQRRADALIELVQRAVSAPDGAPSTDKAKIVVTFDYDTLAQTLADAVNAWNARTAPNGPGGSGHPGFAGGCGDGSAAGNCGGDDPTTSGTRTGNAEPTTEADFAGARTDSRFQRPVRNGQCMSGDVLSPQTVRRLACDAAIIPVVLGSHGQPLDVGREERLVTRAMRTALWLRDRGCTFPGCTIPAQWTEAHHVTHWLHGGTTAVSNLALLCQRHHTHVHNKNLTATITDSRDGPGAAVTWHTWQHWKTGRPPPGRGSPPNPPPPDPSPPD